MARRPRRAHRATASPVDVDADPSALTVACTVDGTETVLTVRGVLEPQRCATLGDGIEAALVVRPAGAVLVDLTAVVPIPLAALAVLRRCAEEAQRAGRHLTVRPFPLPVLGNVPRPAC